MLVLISNDRTKERANYFDLALTQATIEMKIIIMGGKYTKSECGFNIIHSRIPFIFLINFCKSSLQHHIRPQWERQAPTVGTIKQIKLSLKPHLFD